MMAKPMPFTRRSVSWGHVAILTEEDLLDSGKDSSLTKSDEDPQLVSKPILMKKTTSAIEKGLAKPDLLSRRQVSGASSKRMEHMERRRSSIIYSKMWQAHATGISIAPSSKNIFRRTSEARNRSTGSRSSFVSTATMNLLTEGGPPHPDEIFRPPRDIKSRGRSTSRGRASSRGKFRFASDGTNSSIGRPGRPPRRMSRNEFFESSGNLVIVDGDASYPEIERALPVRSESDVSFAQHKRVPHRGSITEMSFPPPIQIANHIRSGSFSSVMSESRPTIFLGTSKPFQNNSTSSNLRPVMLRSASKTFEGVEVTELDLNISTATPPVIDTFESGRRHKFLSEASMISTANSFEDSVGLNRGFIGEDIKRTLSHDDILDMSGARIIVDPDSVNHVGDDDGSWDLGSDINSAAGQPDAWDVLRDEYAIGYGAGGTLPFVILGTSSDDVDSLPHVLSPPLMESLQSFLPFGVSEDNFWMKFSLVRDGTSLRTLLQHVRGARHTIIALETVDGEVFGSFTSMPWRKNWNYFGTGESFLWRMRQSRNTPRNSLLEQAQLESELDVYPWTGSNSMVQFCTHEKLAVGGGVPSEEILAEEELNGKKAMYGFGLAIDNELLHGTSSSCDTFSSPPLSKTHSDGSPFEIVNLEVWTFTPCNSLEEAEKLELGMLFLETHAKPI